MQDVAKMINEELLNIYGCPICKNRLVWREEERQLYCLRCDKIYRISNSDVPILLVNEEEYAKKYKQIYF